MYQVYTGNTEATIEKFMMTLVYANDEPAALRIAHCLEFNELTPEDCLKYIEVWNKGMYLCEFFELMTGYKYDGAFVFNFAKHGMTKAKAVEALTKVEMRISLYSEGPFVNRQHTKVKEWWDKYGSETYLQILGAEESFALARLSKMLEDVRYLLIQTH